MMKHVFGLLLFWHSVFGIDGYDASVCTGLHVSLATFIPSGFQYVFKYSADITLAAVDESHTSLTFSNQTTWTADANNYFQFGPIQFLNDFEVVNCTLKDDNCKMSIYDSLGFLQIPLSLNGTFVSPILNENLFFDHGTVFDINTNGDNSAMTSFFNKASPCKLTKGSKDFSERDFQGPGRFAPLGLGYKSDVLYCCNKFKDITIPTQQSTCTKFDGSTIISDNNKKVLAEIDFVVQTKTDAALSFSVFANTLPNNSHLMATINDDTFFVSFPFGSYCDYYSISSKACTFTQEIINDFQGNLQFRIISSDFSFVPYGPIIAAKLISRNKNLIKNDNQLYTPSDPCWNRNTSMPNGLSAQNSLCCVSFDSSNQTCASYESKTTINVNGFNATLSLKYQFFDKFIFLSIERYDASQESIITVKSFSHDLSTQTCQASTKNHYNDCPFKTSKLNTYDITFKIDVLPSEYSITTITVGVNSQVTSPTVSVNNQCSTSSSTTGISTNFCCSQY